MTSILQGSQEARVPVLTCMGAAPRQKGGPTGWGEPTALSWGPGRKQPLPRATGHLLTWGNQGDAGGTKAACRLWAWPQCTG